MLYRTELHCHSAECSECGFLTADEVARKFIRLKIDTIVMTNHLKTYEIERLGGYERCVDLIFEAYERAKEAAGDKLNVLLGVEVGLDKPRNDYLIYGINREFLMEDMKICTRTPEEVYRRTKEAGMLFIQAHPRRGSCVVVESKYLDGYEIFNCQSDKIPDYDFFAAEWDKHRLGDAPIFTAGSDFHGEHTYVDAGIVTDHPIVTNEDLMNTLRNRSFSIVCRDDIIDIYK